MQLGYLSADTCAARRVGKRAQGDSKSNSFAAFIASFRAPEASNTLVPSNSLYASPACWDVCADDIDSYRKAAAND